MTEQQTAGSDAPATPADTEVAQDAQQATPTDAPATAGDTPAAPKSRRGREKKAKGPRRVWQHRSKGRIAGVVTADDGAFLTVEQDSGEPLTFRKAFATEVRAEHGDDA